MSVAKVVEITATSTKGFDDAIAQGVRRASKTLKEVKEAWVKSMKVEVKDGRVMGYSVALKVTFVLTD